MGRVLGAVADRGRELTARLALPVNAWHSRPWSVELRRTVDDLKIVDGAKYLLDTVGVVGTLYTWTIPHFTFLQQSNSCRVQTDIFSHSSPYILSVLLSSTLHTLRVNEVPVPCVVVIIRIFSWLLPTLLSLWLLWV